MIVNSAVSNQSRDLAANSNNSERRADPCVQTKEEKTKGSIE